MWGGEGYVNGHARGTGSVGEQGRPHTLTGEREGTEGGGRCRDARGAGEGMQASTPGEDEGLGSRARQAIRQDRWQQQAGRHTGRPRALDSNTSGGVDSCCVAVCETSKRH